MTNLVVCPECTRHIRRSEAHCPFCGAAVAAAIARTPERAMPTERLGRAALFAFAAASIGAAACGGSTDTGSGHQPVGDAAADGADDGGNGMGGFAALYGVPPPTGGVTGAGGQTGFPAYGAPPPTGGAPGVAGAPGAGGGFAALYGAAPP